MNQDKLSAYLDKIGYKGELTPTLETLRTIHQLQHETLPFENLNAIQYRNVDLSEEFQFTKLVENQRGGYCFELNGILGRALKAIGFDIAPKLARVHLTGTPSGRGHMVNVVTLDGQEWLIDAGFGATTTRAPLPIILDQELKTDIQTFRFIKDETFGIMLQNKQEETWSDMYSLDMTPVCEGDIAHGNHYSASAEASIFTQNIVAVARHQHGVNIMFNNRLKVTTEAGITETMLKDEEEYNQALKQHFGIVHDVPFDVISRHFMDA